MHHGSLEEEVRLCSGFQIVFLMVFGTFACFLHELTEPVSLGKSHKYVTFQDLQLRACHPWSKLSYYLVCVTCKLSQLILTTLLTRFSAFFMLHDLLASNCTSTKMLSFLSISGESACISSPRSSLNKTIFLAPDTVAEIAVSGKQTPSFYAIYSQELNVCFLFFFFPLQSKCNSCCILSVGSFLCSFSFLMEKPTRGV